MRIYSPQMSLSRENALGGGVYDARLLRALARRGARITIPLLFRAPEETCEGWTVRRIPVRRAFKLGALLTNTCFLATALFDRLVRRERWDVFRIGDPYYVGVAGIVASRLLGGATVCHVHHLDAPGTVPRRREAITRWVARRADLVVAISRFGADQIVHRLGVPADRVRVTYPGTEMAPIPDRDAGKRAVGMTGRFLITHIGALVPRKNLLFLLEVFARGRQAVPEARLALIGRPPVGGEAHERELRRHAAALGIGDAVCFVGFVADAEKERWLAATDVLVVPSRVEGFGMAPVEAMARGVPAVASRRGALPEIVADGVTGLLSDPGDADAFAESVLRLARDEALRARIGAAAREEVRARFAWDKAADEVLSALEGALARRARPGRLGVLLNAGDGLARMRAEGQAERFVGAYLRGYGERFDDVAVFSYGREDDRPWPNVRVLPGRPGLPGLLYGLALPLVHSREIRACRVLRVMQTLGALPAVIARVLYGVPFVTTYGFDLVENLRIQKGGAYPAIGRAVRFLALKTAARVIVTTPTLADAAARYAPRARIVLIPNGVDLARFAAGRREPLSPDRPTRVLCVGRLVNQKNVGALVDAVAQVPYPTTLTIVGDGPERDALARRAADRGVRATLAGAVPFSRMPEMYRDADVLVLPSLGEGQPKVLIEAFAAGLPCIGTDVRGVRDVIEHGVNGILCAMDAGAIAGAIARLIESPDEAARLAAAARRTAEAAYDLRVLIGREVDLLAEVATR